MSPNTRTVLRVLLEFDKDSGKWVAQCLETGNAAPASTPELAQEMIVEILRDELEFARKHDNFENLFGAPAPKDVRERYEQAAKHAKPIQIELFPEVHTGLELARAA